MPKSNDFAVLISLSEDKFAGFAQDLKHYYEEDDAYIGLVSSVGRRCRGILIRCNSTAIADEIKSLAVEFWGGEVLATEHRG